MPDPNLIILAAGVSSRMRRSLGEAGATSLPKSMMPVGDPGWPFLDYVLSNAKRAGYRDVVLVVGEESGAIRGRYGAGDRSNQYHGLSISYAVQTIPAGRTKPLGTADAVLCGARSRPDWNGKMFTVCNSDNIYSVEAFAQLLTTPHPNALIAYDTAGLRFPKEQEYNNAILDKDADGFLTGIREKPGAETFERLRTERRTVEVSMNIFRFRTEMIGPALASTPLHPERNEKEIATTLTILLRQHPRSVYCLSRSEYVPDLTRAQSIPEVDAYVRTTFPKGPWAM